LEGHRVDEQVNFYTFAIDGLFSSLYALVNR